MLVSKMTNIRYASRRGRHRAYVASVAIVSGPRTLHWPRAAREGGPTVCVCNSICSYGLCFDSDIQSWMAVEVIDAVQQWLAATQRWLKKILCRQTGQTSRQPGMNKNSCRWEKLKRGLTLHIPWSLEFSLFFFLFLSIKLRVKRILDEFPWKTTTSFFYFTSLADV